MGRECMECELTGVSANTFAVGLITGPPAESEYAVEPVGVHAMKPSQ